MFHVPVATIMMQFDIRWISSLAYQEKFFASGRNNYIIKLGFCSPCMKIIYEIFIMVYMTAIWKGIEVHYIPGLIRKVKNTSMEYNNTKT